MEARDNPSLNYNTTTAHLASGIYQPGRRIMKQQRELCRVCHGQKVVNKPCARCQDVRDRRLAAKPIQEKMMGRGRKR